MLGKCRVEEAHLSRELVHDGSVLVVAWKSNIGAWSCIAAILCRATHKGGATEAAYDAGVVRAELRAAQHFYYRAHRGRWGRAWREVVSAGLPVDSLVAHERERCSLKTSSPTCRAGR